VWVSTFEQEWSLGLEALSKELKAQGFECEIFLSEKFSWPKVSELKSIESPHFTGYSWGYLAEDKTKHVWPQQAQLLIAHSSRKRDCPDQFAGSILWTTHPEAALDVIVRRLAASEWWGASAPIPSGVHAETQVHVGPDCQIGEGTILETGVRIGARVKIGKNCRIGAFSKIADDSVLGDDCVLSASVVIGGQGFGLAKYPQAPYSRPRLHVGTVEIGKGVRLGSFVSIDRAVFGCTRVGDHSCFDNHVHMGHNCEVGRETVLCGFVGLAGSTRVGSHSVFAGFVGTKGHVDIGSHVTIAAQSGVTAPLPDGVQVKGYPTRPIAEALKIASLNSRLPELYDRIKKIEKFFNSQKKENLP
jgi:UDP-3-O-[3-hydroxymyristoyl] glucosamine N-acyltransferase